MCGIASYVGSRPAAPIVLEGLKRLEYRGYDSAGISVLDGAHLSTIKRAGRVHMVVDAVAAHPLPGTRALGHTRWATHGRPTDRNAHPHVSEDGRLTLVHNGIIENHAALRARLRAEGHTFASETDSEVLVHLIASHFAGDLQAAVRRALLEVEGAWALVVAHADVGGLVAARQTSPLVLGAADGERFAASDVQALLPYTRRVAFLEDGDVAFLHADGVRIEGREGGERVVAWQEVAWQAEAASLQGWPHFMLKEIFEQPATLRSTLAGRVDAGGEEVHLDLTFDPATIERIVVVAAGSASYAGMVGEVFLERLARIPSEVHVASEFRYADPIVDASTLVVGVSQSGETIDTLEALREARRRGAPTLALLNTQGSSIGRVVDEVLDLHAGPEIGVASTKAYLAMVAAFALLALHLGRARGVLERDAARGWIEELRRMPALTEATLERRDAVREVASSLQGIRGTLYLGRGGNVASAYEGALKLKEVTYLHAEAYPMGEMKHGPIALIDPLTPVIALAPEGPLHAKTLSNLQEIRARDGRIVAIASDGDEAIEAHADHVLWIPRCSPLLSPFLVAIPMQLLAYEMALQLGRDVDRPRNLAKSVTVE